MGSPLHVSAEGGWIMGLDHMTAELDMDAQTLKILEQIWELEHEKQHKLQAEGIARAKALGIRFGPSRIQGKNLEKACELYLQQGLSVTDAARICDISRSTFYRRLQEYLNKGVEL